MARRRDPRQAPAHLRWAWIAVAYAALGLGLVGIVVPILPTVPFVLLAAFAASRGSTRLHEALRNHRRYGLLVREWEEQGAVRRKAKWLATSAMAAASVLLFLVAPHPWVAISVAAVMAVVATWLWRRPEPDRPADAR